MTEDSAASGGIVPICPAASPIAPPTKSNFPARGTRRTYERSFHTLALAPERTGIGIRRYFTTEGVHPYDQISWERRDSLISNWKTGEVAFEQRNVEVPASWSVNATNILAQKYFRGTVGTPEREWTLRQVADRVVDTVTNWGVAGGYFVDQAEADAFNAELKHLVINQKAAFNSPV